MVRAFSYAAGTYGAYEGTVWGANYWRSEHRELTAINTLRLVLQNQSPTNSGFKVAKHLCMPPGIINIIY
jgi:hypothetical protein